MEQKFLHVGGQYTTAGLSQALLSRGGEGTDPVPFKHYTSVELLKGKLVYEALPLVMYTPLFQHLLFVLRNIFSSSLANQENVDETKILLHDYLQSVFLQNL